METNDQWIRERTGIERRHIAADGETTVDLAEHAARRALDAAGVRPQDVDFIAFGTTTPDLIFPNCGVLLQGRLGCRAAPCPVSKRPAAASCMRSRLPTNTCAAGRQSARWSSARRHSPESLTGAMRDRDSVRRWRGSGAPRAFFRGRHSFDPSARGRRYRDLLYCGGGHLEGFRARESATRDLDGRQRIFRVAVTTLGKAVDEALAANNLGRSAIDWLVPHQANLRIIQAMARKLELPMERVVVTIQDHGNTSAASVPLALDLAIRDGRIKRGDVLLLEAFGGRLYLGIGAGQVLGARQGGGLKKTPPPCAAFCGKHWIRSDYFEIERLNIRSIFSLVASTAD